MTQIEFVQCELLSVFQKEIRQWLERVSAEQDVPVLWDDEKTPSECHYRSFSLVVFQ